MRIDSLAIGPGISLYHFWSLAIEEQFYLLWPFLVYAARGRSRAVGSIAAVGTLAVFALRTLLAVRHTPYLFLHMSLLTRADSLMVGGLLAVAYRSTYAWPRVLQVSPLACFILSAVLFGPVLFRGEDSGPMWWISGCRYTVLALCFAALLAWSLRGGPLGRFFSQRWIRFLGKYSYGLYVLHVLVLSFVRLPLRYALFALTQSRFLSVTLSGVVCILLSVVVAYVSFQIYEKPFLQLKRQFTYTTVEAARVG